MHLRIRRQTNHANNLAIQLITNARTGGDVDQNALNRTPSTVEQFSQTVQHAYQISGASRAPRTTWAVSATGLGRAKELALQHTMDDFESAASTGKSTAGGLSASLSNATMKGFQTLLTTNNTASPTAASAYKPTDFVRDTLQACFNTGGQPDTILVSQNFLTGMTTWGWTLQRLDQPVSELGIAADVFVVPFLGGTRLIPAPCSPAGRRSVSTPMRSRSGSNGRSTTTRAVVAAMRRKVTLSWRVRWTWRTSTSTPGYPASPGSRCNHEQADIAEGLPRRQRMRGRGHRLFCLPGRPAARMGVHRHALAAVSRVANAAGQIPLVEDEDARELLFHEMDNAGTSDLEPGRRRSGGFASGAGTTWKRPRPRRPRTPTVRRRSNPRRMPRSPTGSCYEPLLRRLLDRLCPELLRCLAGPEHAQGRLRRAAEQLAAADHVQRMPRRRPEFEGPGRGVSYRHAPLGHRGRYRLAGRAVERDAAARCRVHGRGGAHQGADRRTSTGIGLEHDRWQVPRCLFLDDLSKLPQTFGPEHVCGKGEVLLVNTGCWLADLNHPFWDWFATVGQDGLSGFNIRSRLVGKKTLDGTTEWGVDTRSEDWELSHEMHKFGLRYMITQRVKLWHEGGGRWPNHREVIVGDRRADYRSSPPQGAWADQAGRFVAGGWRGRVLRRRASAGGVAGFQGIRLAGAIPGRGGPDRAHPPQGGLRRRRGMSKLVYEVFLGVDHVESIDLHGTDDAHKLDLNYAIADERYDIVFNTGTAEHVFHIGRVLEFVHESTKLGGLMVHCFPLAGLIGPRVLDGQSLHGLLPGQGEPVRDHRHHGFPDRGHVHPARPATARQQIRTMVRTNTLPSNAWLHVAFRRASDAGFIIPTQEIYTACPEPEIVEAWREFRYA